MIKLLITLLLLGLVQSANADFIDSDDHTYFTDTRSGFQWLDVTETAGLSYDQVFSDLLADGEKYEGWQYATADQFNQLISHFTGSPINTYEEVYHDTELDDLIAILGPTYTSANITYTRGMLADYTLLQVSLVAQQVAGIYDDDRIGAGGVEYDDYSIALQSAYIQSNASPYIGSFLVRSVPEPSSLALLILGFLGLGFSRHRKLKT
jgi:hypothetical protein